MYLGLVILISISVVSGIQFYNTLESEYKDSGSSFLQLLSSEIDTGYIKEVNSAADKPAMINNTWYNTNSFLQRCVELDKKYITINVLIPDEEKEKIDEVPNAYLLEFSVDKANGDYPTSYDLRNVGGKNYTADELYEDMKDYYSVSLLLDKIDNSIILHGGNIYRAIVYGMSKSRKINKKENLENMHINMEFLGLDLSKVPTQNLGDWRVYVIPVLYVLTSFASIKITTMAQKKANEKKDVIVQNKEESDEMMESMQQMNNSMLYMTPIMSISIAVIAPLGLALYWLVSNVLMIVERLIINKFIASKEDEEDE